MISVVVPVANEEQALPGFLEHLAPQMNGHEVIVVDGGSDDATGEIARSVAGVRLVEAERGRGTQVQAGADAADGDIILVAHADSRLPDLALPQVQDSCSGGAAWGWFDLRYDSPRHSLGLLASFLNVRSRVLDEPTGENAVFATREVWEASGGCPALPLMEDLALARRLRRVARGTPLPGPVVCSPRRYEAWGVGGMSLRCALLWTAWHAGVPAHLLTRHYPPVR